MNLSLSSTHKNFFYYWLPVVIYCAAIFIQSSRPAPESIPAVPYLDKLLHAGAYALLGLLFFRAYRTTRLKDHPARLAFFSILSAGIYGISDEFHQCFVPSRSAELMDAFADFLGGVLGVFVCLRLGFRERFYLPSCKGSL
jgi:VanZ family protein